MKQQSVELKEHNRNKKGIRLESTANMSWQENRISPIAMWKIPKKAGVTRGQRGSAISQYRKDDS